VAFETALHEFPDGEGPDLGELTPWTKSEAGNEMMMEESPNESLSTEDSVHALRRFGGSEDEGKGGYYAPETTNPGGRTRMGDRESADP
jgi:hypothetical protein